MHRSWGNRSHCHWNPELELRKLRGAVEYRKEYLGDWADSLDVNKLLGEHDFWRYLDQLRWIIEDP
jgi:hypothetical protein